MAAKVVLGAPARAVRRDAARNLERVLSAADAVFAARGLDATLADIADEAGVGVGTIYRRFADKKALIAALLDDKLELVAATVTNAADTDNGWDAFCRVMIDLSGLLLADAALGQILTFEASISGNRLLDVIRPAATAAVKRAQAEGALRPDLRFNDIPPLLVMMTASSAFVNAGNPASRNRYLEIVLDGVRARPDLPRLPGKALSNKEIEAAGRISAERRR